MVANNQEQKNDNHKAKQTNEFKYLGSLITNDGSMKREISERIAKAGDICSDEKECVCSPSDVKKCENESLCSISVISAWWCGSPYLSFLQINPPNIHPNKSSK